MPEHKDAYFCLCCFCNNQFEGDKREVVCPECKKTHGTEQRKVKVEIINGNRRGYYSGTVYINGIRTDLKFEKGFKGDFERFQSKVNSLSNDELLELMGRAWRDQSKHVESMERALAEAQKALKSIEKTVTTLQEEIIKEESRKA